MKFNFTVLHRTSPWLILCLSFYLSSCRQDIQISPTSTEDNTSIFSSKSTEASEAEINSIKEWFNSLPPTSNVQACVAGRTFHPRWDKSKKSSDRIEFEIFENVDKIPFPKMKELNAKQGRKRFVTKEKNGNGNNRKGHIVSFVPSNSFTGNMDDLTTSNFRAMKFDGVLIFEELSGCFGSAYFIEKGVVLKKLILSDITTLLVRDCYSVRIVTDWFQYSPSAGESRSDAQYIGSSYSYGFTCSSTAYGNYDQDQAQGDYSGGGGDSYYTEYLGALETITALLRLCPQSFQFQQIVDPSTSNPQTRLEAGLRNDGIRFTNPISLTGFSSVGFNYATFALPLFAPNFQQGITTAQAATISTNAVNLAVNQIQQQLQMGVTFTNLSASFWSAVNVGIANSLGVDIRNVYIQHGSGAVRYITPQTTQTVVYRVPITNAGC